MFVIVEIEAKADNEYMKVYRKIYNEKYIMLMNKIENICKNERPSMLIGQKI